MTPYTLNNDTICAPATATGGAIGIVRVSGPSAIATVNGLFIPAGGKALKERAANTITFGRFVTADGETLDEVLVSLFRAPHSYTGEDSVEISCHGSAFIVRGIMQTLIARGARTAEPGEFTRRAFAAGKMDLSQAEAVADLIAADSAASHRLALNQMRGGYSTLLAELRDRLLHLTSLLELELDFSDHEDLEFADRSELLELSERIGAHIDRLCRSFSLGNVLKNGVPVAIVGETNAGKSTLLNALLGEERAIVSDISGTTRDAIEGTANIGGVRFRFIDTAGIRETTDTIENIGIERAFSKLRHAEIVVWMTDATEAADQVARLAPRLVPAMEPPQHLVVAVNKTDRLDAAALAALIPALRSALPAETVIEPISALSTTDVDRLKSRLAAMMPSVADDEVVVSNARHYEALTRAEAAIRRVVDGLRAGLSGDLVSQDLRECLLHLSEITGGEITTDEVLGNIFSHFCVGK